MKHLILTCVLLLASFSFASDVKDSDLAGNWYPASKEELTYLLTGYLDDAKPEKIDGQIFAVISPHAGYRFSGPVAAYGFKAVQGRKIKTVIIVGFAHREFFDGISVYEKGSFKTPLGEVPVDTETAKNIIAQSDKISFYPDAFKGENSVEMQLPFIQLTLKDAKIVPIAFGSQSFDDAVILAEALTKILKDKDDYLIIASTDLSHYHSYGDANNIDKHTIELLKKMKAHELYDEARLGISELCGVMPVSAVLLAAEKLEFGNVEILRYANSGDTFGSKNEVVGYLSAAIYKEAKKEGELSMLNQSQRQRLLEIARKSMTAFAREGKRMNFEESDPALNMPAGAFVTLHKDGNLRGCIGNMVGEGPLCQTIANMAIEAATGDPRFTPVSPQELDKIDIEISVLTPLKKVSSHEEVKIPGHGVLVRKGFRSGVYLPQVADETSWSKEEFLTSLCGHKAGLAPDAWKDPATEIYIFTAEIFKEKGAKR